MPDLTYSSVAVFLEVYPNYDTAETESLEILLFQGEQDIDKCLGPRGRYPTGLKLDPTILSDYRKNALARAVAHQAMYRQVKGDEFFILHRPDSQTGPDGSIIGKEPFIAPQASMELGQARLFNLVAGHGRRNIYDLPNQNVGQEPW